MSEFIEPSDEVPVWVTNESILPKHMVVKFKENLEKINKEKKMHNNKCDKPQSPVMTLNGHLFRLDKMFISGLINEDVWRFEVKKTLDLIEKIKLHNQGHQCQ